MQVTLDVVFRCGCQIAMLKHADGTMECRTPGCPNFGKRFKQPTIEAEPMPARREVHAVPDSTGFTI